jgi:UDP-N-acetylmuramate--alanine ligase
VLNSLAAIAICVELDFGIKAIKIGFKQFQGVKRRFTLVCSYNGAEIIDDYAHHPVEIEATLATAKDVVAKRKGRVIAMFQPHRYSRLENLFEDFSNCFSKADKVYIRDVFAAGESVMEGVNSRALVDAISKTGIDASYLSSHEKIAPAIAMDAKEGDIIVMMGAGTITNWTNQLPEELAEINPNTKKHCKLIVRIKM